MKKPQAQTRGFFLSSAAARETRQKGSLRGEVKLS